MPKMYSALVVTQQVSIWNLDRICQELNLHTDDIDYGQTYVKYNVLHVTCKDGRQWKIDPNELDASCETDVDSWKWPDREVVVECPIDETGEIDLSEAYDALDRCQKEGSITT